MKERQDIIAACQSLKASHSVHRLEKPVPASDPATGHTPAALATLVKVEGSSYRLPGARMLVTLAESLAGSLSGGCLESDVFEQAQAVIQSGNACLVQYDTTSEDDLIWGLGLGCQGIAYVLIERLNGEEPNPIAFIEQCYRERQPGVIATVFSLDNRTPARVERLLLGSDTMISNLTNAALAAGLLIDAQAALKHNRSVVQAYSLATETAEAFIEVIQPPLALLICGAGMDALPLVRFARQLGWHVTVIDNRQREATQERFREADEVQLCSPEKVLNQVEIDARTVAVIMTHNYADDLELLKVLLPSSLPYLGILGPKRRTEQLLGELQQEEIILASQRDRLYSPVGLDLGADTSEEIALSIVAEIQAVMQERQGGFLKNRLHPIHTTG